MRDFNLAKYRDVAQLGSAQVWGTWGRWFKSSHPDQGYQAETDAIVSVSA